MSRKRQKRHRRSPSPANVGTSDHYFTATPTVDSDRRIIQSRLRGTDWCFHSDRGVFSKNDIDRGTEMLVEHMILPERGPFIDIGCGYGPIGLVAARLRPDAHVYMVDPNERATGLAERNARLNGVSNVTVLTGKGFEPLPEDLRFTAVLTNPPYRAGKRVVYELIEQSRHRLVTGGTFICVGRTKQGVKSLKRFVSSTFSQVTEIAKGGGYRVIEAKK